MSIHFHREMEILKKNILMLCTQVEENVRAAISAFSNADAKLAERVIQRDRTIDQLEVDLEEECLKILALYQPVAVDLRFIVAALKINNDLERIGDQAVNIAYRARLLAGRERVDIPSDLSVISEKAQNMLSRSVDAFINLDIPLARKVCESDDEVDAINRAMYSKVESKIIANVEHLDSYIMILETTHQVERIADLATNIAEDVIYMASGDIIRHRIKLEKSHN